MRRKDESGQAILMVVLAIGILLLGAMGLAIDGAQIYSQHHMAQVAADAGAMAAIMSLFDKSNSSGATTDFSAINFTCVNGTDTKLPCQYVRTDGCGLNA